MSDYYEILGIGKNASKDEIRRAYRRLAHEHHPDKGGGQAEKFKAINEAYEVLSDDAKRAQYDQFGQTFEQARASGAGFGGFGGFSDFSEFMRGFGQNYSRGPFAGMEFDFGDIFSDIFGSPRGARREQGVDLEMGLQIEFLEAVFGVNRDVTIEKNDICPECRGSGAESGSQIVTCPKCHGQGQIVHRRASILGNLQHIEICDHCGGSGKIPEKNCPVCRGRGIKKMKKTISVSIPAGVEDGSRLRVSDEGEMGYRGSRRGDLYIVIRVRPHPEFKRMGLDILSEAAVSFYEAALGAKKDIKTADGEVELKIPAGIQSGKVLRLSGKGVHSGHARGDHLVTVRVVTPTKLTKREKELFRQLAAEQGEGSNASFWEKLKDRI